MSCKKEWFSGNEYACQIYDCLGELAHTWDDLVDKDKEVSEQRINKAFYIALVYLPTNPLYDELRHVLAPLWVTIISAYETANRYERDKDEHGIEIAHTLRYAAGHIVSYLITYCSGPDKAREYMPEAWKDIIPERFNDYRKEHLSC
jgi:hypothetical protein